MNDLDHAIDSLAQLCAVYSRNCDTVNFARTHAELRGWQDVRDGKPHNEIYLHHAELRYLYRQARHDAYALLQPTPEEPCTKKTSNM